VDTILPIFGGELFPVAVKQWFWRLFLVFSGDERVFNYWSVIQMKSCWNVDWIPMNCLLSDQTAS
jgi:hypothetical protein